MLLQCAGGPTDRVLLINLDQPVHFGSYMLRRAILVERSIRTCRIVRVFLICALLKRCFERSPNAFATVAASSSNVFRCAAVICDRLRDHAGRFTSDSSSPSAT